jgi:DNA-directed RNA polymerase subunit P
MYRCGKCKEMIHADINMVGIQCEKCGYKIFYKCRQNVRKMIKAR